MSVKKSQLHILLLSLNLIFIIGLATLIQYHTFSRKTQSLTFYISGEVNFPGIYIVEGSITVAEAIMLAGGFTVNADIGSLDLAEGLTNYRSVKVAANKSNNAKVQALNGAELININLASLAELDNLPGIGPVLAAKITETRPYKTLADLEALSGISKSVIENIKDLIEF